MVGKSQNYQQRVHVEANLIYKTGMSCKKGGFVTIRHNELRDLTAKYYRKYVSILKLSRHLFR